MRYSGELLRKKLWGKIRNPIRLVGGELNLPRKNFEDASVRMVLAFPDLYHVGMSNLGWQILYHIVNAHEKFAAERVFAVPPEVEKLLKREGLNLYSLETYTPLKEFDVVGISLSHELLFTTMLQILDLGGIPLKTGERDGLPIVIAGGPGVANPEPIAPFVDATFHGDGEEAIIEILEIVRDWKESGGSRDELLMALASVEGIYVPSFYEPEFRDNRLVGYSVRRGVKEVVRSRLLPDLNKAPFPVKQLVPLTQTVHDRFVVEVARGCVRSCRFCQAGMIYRPVRERDVNTILEMVVEGVKRTGMSDVSFLSLSVGDYTRIGDLVEEIMRWGEGEKVALSFPSIRVDTLDAHVLEEIRKVRKTGFTIAPETGSDRLRRVVNKYWTNDDIIKTASMVARAGWRLIKLYFMVGLPTEREEDREEIVELSKSVKKVIKNVNASVALFVPKPHTPFQWERFAGIREGWDYLRELGGKLRRSRINFKWHLPEMSFLETVIGRGDRRVAEVILHVYERGGRLDSWNEYFDMDLWMDGFRSVGLDPQLFAGEIPENSFLPWDHISYGVLKKFLKRERKKARREERTPFCLNDRCSACGVCDFKTIDNVKSDRRRITLESPGEIGDFKHVVITYRRKGIYSYISSRDLTRNWGIFFRKAGLKVKFTGGYHPLPKLSFVFPAPVGVESEEEIVEVWVDSSLSEDLIKERLNGVLPEEFLPITIGGRRITERDVVGFRYVMEGDLDPGMIEDFIKREAIAWVRVKKGRKKEKNIKDYVRIIDYSTRRVTFDLLLRDDGTVPVNVVLEEGFGVENPFSRMKIRRIKIITEEKEVERDSN